MEAFDGAEKEVFLALMAEASKSYVVPQVQKHVYENLGHYIVEHSELLLVLWDGTTNFKKGGTVDVLTYAKVRRGV